MAQGQPGFLLAQEAVGLARTVPAPEIWVERRAVSAEQNVGLSHALHERGTGDRLIIGMRHDDQSASQEASQGAHVFLMHFPHLRWEITEYLRAVPVEEAAIAAT